MSQAHVTFDSVRRVRGVFYGWWLAGVAALVMALGTVPLFSAMPVWIVVLERNFGWNRTQLALAFAFTRVEGGLLGPVEGYLIDRLGSRRMVLIGMPILGAGFLWFSRMHSLWEFYLAFMVMSAGAGLGTWLPMMTALNHWFRRRRATAMAIAMEGFNVGTLALVPALAWAIDPDQFGLDRWRAVAAGIGVALIVLAFPMSRLVRNRPEDYGLLPYGSSPASSPAAAESPPRASSPAAAESPPRASSPAAAESPPRASSPAAAESPPLASRQEGYTWQQALRTRTFWLITIGHSCSSIVIVTIMVHLGPMLDDRGFSLPTVGWVVSIQSIVGGIFILVGGYIGDRLPIRMTLFGFSAVQSVAVMILLQAHTPAVAFLFAVVMGIGFGGRTPLSTAVRGIYFGRRAFASITGVSMVPMNFMLLAAPLFAGIMFEATGSYAIPFTTVAVVSFIGATAFLFLGDPPDWDDA